MLWVGFLGLSGVVGGPSRPRDSRQWWQRKEGSTALTPKRREMAHVPSQHGQAVHVSRCGNCDVLEAWAMSAGKINHPAGSGGAPQIERQHFLRVEMLDAPPPFLQALALVVAPSRSALAIPA